MDTAQTSIAGDIHRHLTDTLLLGPAAGVTQPLFDSGLIDSAGFVMLVSFLEDRFGIILDGDDLVPENFDTVDRMAALVERKHAA